eukprot:1136144-Pelagomonas_calceolata.AAC.5
MRCANKCTSTQSNPPWHLHLYKGMRCANKCISNVERSCGPSSHTSRALGMCRSKGPTCLPRLQRHSLHSMHRHSATL